MPTVRIPLELPSLESLPHTTCRVCRKSKINGLFTPWELREEVTPRCMRCIGEISEKQRAHARKGLDR